MARSKVNVKFVILLAGCSVAAVGGLIGLYYSLVYRSSAQYATRADEKLAAGDARSAIDLYSKAVFKEQTNPEWLMKWRDAMVAFVPEDRIRFENQFEEYKNAVRQLAIIQRENVKNQADHLELMKRMAELSGNSPNVWKQLENDANQFLEFHAESTNNDWKELLRYRGMARVLQLISTQNPEIAAIQDAKKDIEEAIAFDPNDTDSIIILSDLHYILSERAAQESRKEEASRELATSTAVILSGLERAPQNPSLLLAMVQRSMDKARRELSGMTDQKVIRERSLILQKQLIPMLETAKIAVVDAKGVGVENSVVMRMKNFEETIDPASRLARTEEIARQALLASPTNAELLQSLAEILSERPDPTKPGANFANAITQMQQVIDLPAKGVGLDGLLLFQRKRVATFRQALWSSRRVMMLMNAPAADEESKKAVAAALVEARDYRTKLLAVESASSAEATLVDAHLAFIDTDYRKANTLLTKFNKDTNNTDPDSLLLYADVALKLNQPGAARDALMRVIELDSSNLMAMFALGQVELQLANFPRAREIFNSILRMIPDNETAKRALATISTIESGQGTVEGTIANSDRVDPVISALSEAERLARTVELEADGLTQVVALLQRKADELNDDPRLVRALAVHKVRNGDRDGAKASLDRAISKHDKNQELRAMRAGLESTDPIESQIAMIEVQDAPEFEKHLVKSDVYRKAKMDDKAKLELDAAEKLDPTNTRVLELRFMDAIENDNMAKAQELVDIAIARDADTLGGFSFRARMQAAQKKYAEAANTMQQAVDRGGAGPESYRLLGRMYMLAKRGAEATRSYEQALRLRPNDIGTVSDLIISLSVSGRNDEALAAARRYERIGRGDRSFLDLWLDLEAGVGIRAIAISERERILRSTPDDRANNVALIGLYITSESWSNARALIDRVRSKTDGLDIVFLDASWHWAQKDETKSRAAFDAYIANLGADNKEVRPFLVYAQFLSERNDLPGAFAILEKARPLQNPKTLEVDRSLVSLGMATNRNDEAIAACRRVVDGKADTEEQTYRKQLISLLQATNKLDEADVELAKLPQGRDSDVDSMLLRAESATRRDDAAGNKRILDEAVANFPNDSRVFLARGQLLLNSRDTARDSVEDFSRAIQLRPDLARAFQLRAVAHSMIGNTNEALNDLEAALRSDPSDNNLFFGVVSDMLRQKQTARAQKAAEQVLALRPPSIPVLVQLGDIYRSFFEHDAASRMYRRAWDLDTEKSNALAQRMLDSMMEQKPQKVQEADIFLRSLGTEKISKNPGFLMSGARIKKAQNDMRTAGVFAIQAVKLLDANEPGLMMAWFQDMRRLQDDRKRLISFLQTTEDIGITPEWINYFLGRLYVDVTPAKDAGAQPVFDAADMSRGEEILNRLTQDAQSVPVKNLSIRALGESKFLRRDFAGSTQVFKRGTEMFPDDWELKNNLAFILTKYLGKADEALPYSEAANAASVNSPEVLDTLGLIYTKLNRCEEALEPLRRARLLSRNTANLVSITAHQAEALWCTNRKEDARTTLKEARDLAAANPDAIEYELRDELNRLEEVMR